MAESTVFSICLLSGLRPSRCLRFCKNHHIVTFKILNHMMMKSFYYSKRPVIQYPSI
jgi:hypothetical protein